jgi:hypothetical protein
MGHQMATFIHSYIFKEKRNKDMQYITGICPMNLLFSTFYGCNLQIICCS